MSKLNPVNCRAALGLLGWTWGLFKERAGVSQITVARFMRGEAVSDDSREKMREAIEGAGVKLYNSDRPGARLMDRSSG